MIKSERGVTLIALIFTLIIMIILTGVVLRFTVGDHEVANSIFYQVRTERNEQVNTIVNIQEQNDNTISKLEYDWGIQ